MVKTLRELRKEIAIEQAKRDIKKHGRGRMSERKRLEKELYELKYGKQIKIVKQSIQTTRKKGIKLGKKIQKYTGRKRLAKKRQSGFDKTMGSAFAIPRIGY